MKYLIFLLTTSLLGFEFNLNSHEETLISVNDLVIATNCSPVNLGKVIQLSRPIGTSDHLLKFVPTGEKGEVNCSFKTSKYGILKARFKLFNQIKNPIIEINSLNNRLHTNNLNHFKKFIKREWSDFEKVKNPRIIYTKKFRYEFVDSMTLNSHYFYRIVVRSRLVDDSLTLLDQEKISSVLFSYYLDENLKEVEGLQRSGLTILYLQTKTNIIPDLFEEYLP